MVAFDWILAAMLLLSLLLGAWRGLVYEALSLLAWVVAFVLAQWYALDLAELMPLAGASEPVRYAVGFVAVFIAAAFAGGLVAWIAKRLVEAIGLRPVDRVLGAAFGLLRGTVLLLAIAVVVNVTALKGSAWWQASQGAAVLTETLKSLRPALPERFARYLP
ncbi:MAG: Colicin V production protein [Burkholderiaceae bacterium]|jgi:membrane protein required for colicin V production|nr:MAG: Colicin V production protein [Burkholderiaceae bacterium]